MSSDTTVPSYVDNAACLCALQPSRAALDNSNELWRCIGNVTADATSGSTGKWYRTQAQGSTLAGLGNQPQNWAGYPPDLRATYVLIQDGEGNLAYQTLGSGNQHQLTPVDARCSGKNDTHASTTYYTSGAAAVASRSTTQATATASTGLGLKKQVFVLVLFLSPLVSLFL